MLLSKTDIARILRPISGAARFDDSDYLKARAIEAAYEAKLREQEPVAFYDGNRFYANEESAICGCADMAKLKPVFTHPAPIPEGWQLVPIEPTDKLWFAGVVIKDDMAASYKAMLAAARSGEWKT